MTPPGLTRMSAETFQDAPVWFIETFLPLHNNFLSDVSACLTRGLSVDENLRAAYLEGYQLDTPTTVTDGFPFYLAVPSAIAKPREVRITRVELPDAPATVLTSPVWCHWDLATRDGKTAVRVRHITGLSGDTRYKLTFRME